MDLQDYSEVVTSTSIDAFLGVALSGGSSATTPTAESGIAKMGGRLGNAATRGQILEIGAELESRN